MSIWNRKVSAYLQIVFNVFSNHDFVIKINGFERSVAGLKKPRETNKTAAWTLTIESLKRFFSTKCFICVNISIRLIFKTTKTIRVSLPLNRHGFQMIWAITWAPIKACNSTSKTIAGPKWKNHKGHLRKINKQMKHRQIFQYLFKQQMSVYQEKD